MITGLDSVEKIHFQQVACIKIEFEKCTGLDKQGIVFI